MTADEINNKRVAVLLSGGVDSSVVLYELFRQGLHPDCFYIKIGPEEETEWDCSSEEDLEMATAVARKYGCRLDVIDCHREYWENVTRYTMDKVRAGLTPNPDVMCNQLIKFGAFEEKMGHDYDITATGHYAQTEWHDGRKWLVAAPDPVKDQTDFLAQLHPWQLRKAVFPIGHMMKDEGDVVEQDTGRIIGHHRGLWFHTIGQRKGLGFGGGPWFVVDKDVAGNILYVAHGYDPKTAYCSEFRVIDFHEVTWSELTAPDGLKEYGAEVTFKIRHTPGYLPGRIEWTAPGAFIMHASAPIHGVAPGQFCVVYDRQHHRCFGSGEIRII